MSKTETITVNNGYSGSITLSNIKLLERGTGNSIPEFSFTNSAGTPITADITSTNLSSANIAGISFDFQIYGTVSSCKFGPIWVNGHIGPSP